MMARQAESGGWAARNVEERQKENFNRAAMRRVGIEDSEGYYTPDMIDNNYNRMGTEFICSARKTISCRRKTFRTV